MSGYFTNNVMTRISGALQGALVFFIVTNLGVWTNGMYGDNIEGLVTCYTMAIPFFAYSLISTLIFSTLIESICKIKIMKNILVINHYK